MATFYYTGTSAVQFPDLFFGLIVLKALIVQTCYEFLM